MAEFSRDDIVRIARSWIGTPFRHQGRTRAGIDCVGLIVVVAAELGITGVDVPGYTRWSYGDQFLVPFRRHARPSSFARMDRGDMIVFHSRIFPCHTGILSRRADGSWGVVHAVANLRKTWETAWAGEWQDAARHVYAFPGLRA